MAALAPIVAAAACAAARAADRLLPSLSDERLLALQLPHQRVKVFELGERRPSGVAAAPVRFRREPDGERLGEVLVGMALRVPRVDVLHEALAVRLRIVELRIRLRRAAKQRTPLPPQAQLVDVVDHVPGFVPENAHAPLVIAAFDLEHLRLFQPLQARMRQIEGHGHRRRAVRREPLVGNVEVDRKPQLARLELRAQLRDAPLDHRVLEDRAADRTAGNRGASRPEAPPSPAGRQRAPSTARSYLPGLQRSVAKPEDGPQRRRDTEKIGQGCISQAAFRTTVALHSSHGLRTAHFALDFARRTSHGLRTSHVGPRTLCIPSRRGSVAAARAGVRPAAALRASPAPYHPRRTPESAADT